MKKIVVMLLFFVTACGSLGAKFEQLEKPNSNEALIYYYRPSRFLGSGVYYDVKENDEVVTTLFNGGYSYHRTKAGDKIITAKTEAGTQIAFEAEEGKTYFVRGKVHMGALMGRPALKLIPEDKALKEIQECRIIEQK